MNNFTDILVAVEELEAESPIILKWNYLNGFTLFTLLERRKYITPFADLGYEIAQSIEKWDKMDVNERQTYCNRANALRSGTYNVNLKELMRENRCVQELPLDDAAMLFGTQMLMRDAI